MEITAALSVIVVVLGVVSLLLYRKIHYLNQVLHDLKNNPPDWANTNAHTLLENAAKQAETIVAQAETEGLKVTDNTKLENEKYAQEYHQKLDQLSTQLANTINANMELVRQRYEEFIKQNEQKLEESQGRIEGEMRTKVNALLFNFEENLASFLSNSEQKSFEAINLELKSAKQLVESYKSQQLGLIDENIVAILERTLQLILKERLSLTNQLDLIYESLEQAKAEKFFG